MPLTFHHMTRQFYLLSAQNKSYQDWGLQLTTSNYSRKPASRHSWLIFVTVIVVLFPNQRVLNFRLSAKHVAAPSLPIPSPGSLLPLTLHSRFQAAGPGKKNPIILFTGTATNLWSPAVAGPPVLLAVLVFVPSQLRFRFPYSCSNLSTWSEIPHSK